MSLTFKLLSLVIRTAAKPIGNYIKKQAKEHDGFRRFAVAQAQRLHRIDMRMRLGILHDPAAQERMHEREQRAADEKKRQAETPTVRSEVEQKKYDEQKAKEEKDGGKKEEKPRKVQIRPLSEARAIDLGANFFSEAFIFAVAAGLLVWDSWRSRRKESQRRDDVAERLLELESEVELLKSEVHPDSSDMESLIQRIKETKQAKTSWWKSIGWVGSTGETKTQDVAKTNDTEESSKSDKPVESNETASADEKHKKPAESNQQTGKNKEAKEKATAEHLPLEKSSTSTLKDKR